MSPVDALRGFAFGGGTLVDYAVDGHILMLSTEVLALNQPDADLSRLGDAVTPEGDAAFLDGFSDGVMEAGVTVKVAVAEWLVQWRLRLERDGHGADKQRAAMRAKNPAIIARNHRIEEAIAAANYGDFSFFERLTAALEKPYEDQPDYADLMTPPTVEERVLRTFCGT